MLESLELWLRRVIDFAMRDRFGADYLDATDSDAGAYLLNKRTREGIHARVSREPTRFPRLIDAAFLDDEIYVVCHPKLYDTIFGPFFVAAYPLGGEELRVFLSRLVPVRNALSHSNPISVRQAEQTICYVNDTIDSIKERFETINMGNEYNAPTITKISDSLGFSYAEAQISRNLTGRGLINAAEDSKHYLTVGDTFSVEAEIDPSFSPNGYTVEWAYPNQRPEHSGTIGTRITLKMRDCDVNHMFTVTCQIKTNKSWHRCGDVDDAVSVIYRVIPGSNLK